MQRVDIVFEMLHYMAVDSTIMSVEYIEKNIDTDSYMIVIVDNASPDGSGKILAERYMDSDKVTVISNLSNEGFTRGNNFGIRYIRNHYDCEFMVVMNNDVMLIETAFLYKLRKYMDIYGFAVAGPNVVQPYGTVSNPVAYELPSDRLLSERIKGPENMLKFDKIGLMGVYTAITYTCFRIKRFIKGETKKKYVYDMCDNVVLHGSFWIFSNRYFEAYDELADKKYMYGEEETLQLCIERAGLVSIYMPDVIVLHLHAMSSNEAYASRLEKERFAAMNQRETWKEYIELRNRL